MNSAARQLDGDIADYRPAPVVPRPAAAPISTPSIVHGPEERTEGLVFRGVIIGLPIAAMGWAALYVLARYIFG